MAIPKNAGGRAPLKFRRANGGANRSRKDIMEARRVKWAAEQKKVEALRLAEKQQKLASLQKAHNKKTNKVFDRATLQVVQDGLVAAIEALGEQVTPISLFMGAFTTLSKSPDRLKVPYLLTIISACLPRLSQGLLHHQLEPSFTLCEQLIAENAATNNLITDKAMMFAQRLLLSLENPSMDIVRSFQRLEPSKLQKANMKAYLSTFRKLLEQAALCCTSETTTAPVKDALTGYYPLSSTQRFYAEAVPLFISVCVGNVVDAPLDVVRSSMAEMSQLFERSLSPYIVESREGRQMLDGLLSDQLLSLLKPVSQHYWGMALEVLETLFNRLNYLKRVKNNTTAFTERFPSVVFLLKVLNKLRIMDDSQLNGKVERVMVAIGKGMSVHEFDNIIQFDPRNAHEAVMRGDTDGDLWATSYSLGVLRRIASHDSLPYFTEHYFPLIQYCSRMAVEAEKSQRSDDYTRWSSLLLQYWRVAVGFCHYPVEVTAEAFRKLAQQLMGMMGNTNFVDTSATAIHVLCDGYYKLSQGDETDEDDDDDAFGTTGAAPTEERLKDDLREKVSYRHQTWSSKRVVRKSALEEDDLFLSMNDPGWHPNVYHNITSDYAKSVCESVFAKYSANIMPKMCNTFGSHDSTAVLLAIQSFSKVCSPNVMGTILEGILQVGTTIAAQAEENVSTASRIKSGNAPLTTQRRMMLDIACAVVHQLPSEHVIALFENVIEPVLMDPAPESRLLQKKAYKLLYSLFEHRIKDIFSFFSRIAGLLSVGRRNVTISGMKMRIRCLSWALDACKMYLPEEVPNTIRSMVGEVVIFSRERSSETRAMTMEVLEKMQRYMEAAGAPVNALLHLVLAGLSGNTSTMVASSVVCMAKLVYLTHDQLPEQDLHGAVAVAFQLMGSSMQEVRMAAALFARMSLKLMKRSRPTALAVEKSLPKLLLAIALTTSQPHVSSNVRVQMRVLLEKCIKRFTYAHIDPIFPTGSKNFLRYTNKMLQREVKKTEREMARRKEHQQNAFDKLFLGAAMRAGEEASPEEDLLQAGALTSFVSRHTAPALPGLTEDDGHEADMEDEMHLDFKDGKLRIISREEHSQEVERARRQELADKLLRRHSGLANADTINDVARAGKRSRPEAEDFENEELVLRYGNHASQEAAQRAALEYGDRRGPRVVGPSVRQIDKTRDQKAERLALKRQRVEEDIRKGDEFMGKGEGDVKRGNIEPYAYVPLNRRYMNRRNERQALHRFEVVSTKHLKGEKAKAARSMKRKP